MLRIVKLIVGFASIVLVTGVVIGVSVHFTRKAKNESSLPGSLSNTTISSTTDTNNNITMFTVSSVTNETIFNTSSSTIGSSSSGSTSSSTVGSPASGSISNNIIESSTSGITSSSIIGSPASSIIGSPASSITSSSIVGSPASSITSSSIIGSPTSSVTSSSIIGSPASSITSSSIIESPASSVTSISISSSISNAITHITSANMISNRSTNISTNVTAAMTSTSTVCSIDFQPIVLYTPDNDYYVGTSIVAVADFNNDSYLDIVTTNYENSSIGILLGNGDGTFQPETKFFAGNNTYPTTLAIGDLNNDGRLDIVVSNYDSSNIVVFLGNGDGTLTAQKPISTGSSAYPIGIVLGYFNRDNILDVAVANSGSNRISIFTGNGNGTFQSQKSLSTGSGSAPIAVAAGDFNHDNYTDLAACNGVNSKVSVFLGYGNGSFQSQMTFLGGNTPFWINVADLNGDSNLDIAVLNVGSYTIGILLGIGNGTFGTQTLYPISNSSSSQVFAIADMNNDGRWDIAVANTDNDNVGILLGRGDGTFGVQLTFSTGVGSSPFGIAVADLNRDNRSDIVLANSGTDDVAVLLGAC